MNAPKVVTIEEVQMQSIKGENGEESKPVMYFKDFPKPMVLNNVNWMSIESEYGDDSDLWTGKRIELHVDPNIMFGNKRVGGVRIRMPRGDRTTAAPLAPPSSNGTWTWAEAVQKAVDAGITEPELKSELKAKGLTGYSPSRDTALVRDLILAKSELQALGTEQKFEEENIPF